LIPAAVLILFALWILAGLALACSTRLDIIPTLAICSALFLLGIMSDYLFGRARKQDLVGIGALHGDTELAAFWLADALETDKTTFHWAYVGKAFGYVVGYVGAVLALRWCCSKNGTDLSTMERAYRKMA